jgi:hypothetical protein
VPTAPLSCSRFGAPDAGRRTRCSGRGRPVGEGAHEEAGCSGCGRPRGWLQRPLSLSLPPGPRPISQCQGGWPLPLSSCDWSLESFDLKPKLTSWASNRALLSPAASALSLSPSTVAFSGGFSPRRRAEAAPGTRGEGGAGWGTVAACLSPSPACCYSCSCAATAAALDTLGARRWSGLVWVVARWHQTCAPAIWREVVVGGVYRRFRGFGEAEELATKHEPWGENGEAFCEEEV